MKWLNGDHQKAVRYTGLKNKGMISMGGTDKLVFKAADALVQVK